jgi:hypothetical protein
MLKAAVKMDPRFLVSNRPTLAALLCLICALLSLSVAQDKPCTAPSGGSTCMCKTDAGKIIDLSPLSRSDGKAEYVTVLNTSISRPFLLIIY